MAAVIHDGAFRVVKQRTVGTTSVQSLDEELDIQHKLANAGLVHIMYGAWFCITPDGRTQQVLKVEEMCSRNLRQCFATTAQCQVPKMVLLMVLRIIVRAHDELALDLSDDCHFGQFVFRHNGCMVCCDVDRVNSQSSRSTRQHLVKRACAYMVVFEGLTGYHDGHREEWLPGAANLDLVPHYSADRVEKDLAPLISVIAQHGLKEDEENEVDKTKLWYEPAMLCKRSDVFWNPVSLDETGAIHRSLAIAQETIGGNPDIVSWAVFAHRWIPTDPVTGGRERKQERRWGTVAVVAEVARQNRRCHVSLLPLERGTHAETWIEEHADDSVASSSSLHAACSVALGKAFGRDANCLFGGVGMVLGCTSSLQTTVQTVRFGTTTLCADVELRDDVETRHLLHYLQTLPSPRLFGYRYFPTVEGSSGCLFCTEFRSVVSGRQDSNPWAKKKQDGTTPSLLGRGASCVAALVRHENEVRVAKNCTTSSFVLRLAEEVQTKNKLWAAGIGPRCFDVWRCYHPVRCVGVWVEEVLSRTVYDCFPKEIPRDVEHLILHLLIRCLVRCSIDLSEDAHLHKFAFNVRGDLVFFDVDHVKKSNGNVEQELHRVLRSACGAMQERFDADERRKHSTTFSMDRVVPTPQDTSWLLFAMYAPLLASTCTSIDAIADTITTDAATTQPLNYNPAALRLGDPVFWPSVVLENVGQVSL